MSRYAATFDRLRARREGALGAFVMLGDPANGPDVLDRLVDGGADLLEVGIPFSDPVADGPTIQAAADRALAAGTTPADCFDMLGEFRARHPDVPVGILTYANLVLARGRGAFYAAAAEAGVDSVLVADVPALEAEPFAAAARAHGLDHVMIAATNTPEPTLARISALGAGYTYCVARAGVTGAETAMRLHHAELFATLKRLDAPPPVLGFGISTPDHVRDALAGGAAGIICGSAIVQYLASGDDARPFVRQLKEATRFDQLST